MKRIQFDKLLLLFFSFYITVDQITNDAKSEKKIPVPNPAECEL